MINILAGSIIKKKIINNTPNFITSVDKIKVNILSGKITVKNLQLTHKQNLFNLTAPKIELNKSFLQLLSANLDTLKKISLTHAYLHINKTNGKENNRSLNNKHNTLFIEHLKLKNCSLIITNKEDTILNLKEININATKAKITPKSKNFTYPFNASKYDISINSVFYNYNKYESLSIKNCYLNNQNISLHNLKIVPKYSKKELQNHLKKERDWISLNCNKLNISNLNIKKNKNTLINCKKITMDSVNLHVYKDKSLPDQNKLKNLYSKSLRELNENVNIDSIFIKKSNITYEEKLNKSEIPGVITFSDINADISNLNNYKPGNSTEINLSSKFLEYADFKFKWNFEILNKNDEFSISGSIKNLNTQSTNRFINPNMNISATGYINELYYTFYGNNYNAYGNMSMTYRDLSLKFKNDEKENKKLVSLLANIFIKNNEDNLKEVKIEVERNQKKSFFNYYWLCLKAGLMDNIL
ncbi:hypothetical protein [Abyssalbus ytuae]|uniref:Uncharacterized protein n=1 Tax=Abyssalbus ytuae TaxID=2926907 RepID=A0A9E6ZR03_9FLAO|nr:hypothetical protein [Abyssalbus ytuae]UOB19324.1 hypothetical protein MQE35_08495 [Abyssalbus ytuae]